MADLGSACAIVLRQLPAAFRGVLPLGAMTEVRRRGVAAYHKGVVGR